MMMLFPAAKYSFIAEKIGFKFESFLCPAQFKCLTSKLERSLLSRFENEWWGGLASGIHILKTILMHCSLLAKTASGGDTRASFFLSF